MSEARATDATVWYGLTAEEATKKLGVDPARGLDDAEVTRRREQYGPNRLAEPPTGIRPSGISAPVQGS